MYMIKPREDIRTKEGILKEDRPYNLTEEANLDYVMIENPFGKDPIKVSRDKVFVILHNPKGHNIPSLFMNNVEVQKRER